jgi:uncharacterized repeat protein (TIGR01451 family)
MSRSLRYKQSIAKLAAVLLALPGLLLALPVGATDSGEYNGVVVKFVDDSGVRLVGPNFQSNGRPLSGIDRAVAARAGARAARLFDRPASALAEERSRGQARTGRPLADLNAFYRIDLPDGADAEALAAELNQLHIVQEAYVAPKPAPPPVTPDFESEQGYLNDPPDSIGSRIAWAIPGGRGNNVTISDVEYDWNITHEDLSTATEGKVLLLAGETRTDPFPPPDHGTAELGIMIGDDNGIGVTGMVNLADIRMAPQNIDNVQNVANAINRSSAVLGAGDVMLLEVQTAGANGGCDENGQLGCVAVEYNLAEFNAIQTASALGIVVVEAAGNGSQDLDSAAYGTLFDRTVRDSGAIIVGAGFPPGFASPARSKHGFSTYGSRVDVQAWGTGITTTGYGDRYMGPTAADQDEWYTGTFGGTSGASPIVTSAVVAIQSIEIERGAPPLSPAAMRSLLVTTGTPQQDSPAFPAASFPIGPLPDLSQALSTDVEVQKIAPVTAVAGEQIFYTIEVFNHGPLTAPSVVVTDTLPDDVDFIVDNLDLCEETFSGSGVVECDFGDLAVGEGSSTVIKGAIAADTVLDAGGPTAIINTAEVASAISDPDDSNNTAVAGTIVEDEANLAVTKLCKPDRELLAGEEGICTILIDNYGPSWARHVVAMDALVSDGEFTILSAELIGGLPNACAVSNTTFVCNLGDLEPATTGSSGRRVIEVKLTATEQVDINDLTRVLSVYTPDPDISNNESRGSIMVSAVADLELEKVAAADVVAGTGLVYDLTVTNHGPSTAVNVVVEDVMPANVTIVSATGTGASCDLGAPGDPFLPTICSFGTLVPGEVRTMQVITTVNPETLGLINNNARTSSDTFDVNGSNDLDSVSTLVSGSADLSLTKSDSPDPALAGEEVTYQLTVSNNGPSTAVDVAVSDLLPPETSFVSATISNGTGTCVALEAPPDQVVCDLNDLDPGQFASVFIVALVDPSVPDQTVIENLATASAATLDPDESNNDAVETTTVLAEADLGVVKTSNKETGNSSTTIIYTIEVTNAGPSDAQNVVAVDTLPLSGTSKQDKVVFVFETSNGACSVDGNNVITCECSGATPEWCTLPAGDTISFDIHVQTKGNLGTITNAVEVSSDTADPNPVNDADTKDVIVQGGSGKTGGPGGGRG